MSAANPNMLLSGRAQERLSQLHRALASDVRALSSQHSLFMGALQGCNPATQNLLMRDYLERVSRLKGTIERMHLFVGRRLSPLAPMDEAAIHAAQSSLDEAASLLAARGVEIGTL